ncbi:MAG: hypothetical protein ACR2HR_02480 [Euzebya sp.]
MNQPDIPIACSLSADDAANQVLEWTDLQRHVLSTQVLPHGVVMTLPLELAEVIEDLARREAACCGFLDITTTQMPDHVRLQITSEQDQALPVIQMLSGVEAV